MSVVASKVLVADDEPGIRCLVQAVLELDSYEVLLAVDGREAVQMALDKQPDLILLDVMMPGIDGYSVCRQLKSLSQFRNVPVIMLSAINADSDNNKWLEAGANGYVSKPFSPQQLSETVKEFLTGVKQ